MSKTMQNLFILMEPSDDAWNPSLKGGKMIMNRFCIDEEAAFELSGVLYLKQSSSEIMVGNSRKLKEACKVKGKEFLFLRFYLISQIRKLIFMNIS